MKPQLLIGAATSGSGKTTFTMGLLRALHKRGLRVQPFKCGPDYIDTQFHTLAADHESVNLDTWMASNTHVQHLYNKYGDGADVCVTEGVMGLFDGYQRMQGSSAEIARLLNIPVVLIVSARSTAYSVAPLIYGFKHFNPAVKIAGIDIYVYGLGKTSFTGITGIAGNIDSIFYIISNDVDNSSDSICSVKSGRSAVQYFNTFDFGNIDSSIGVISIQAFAIFQKNEIIIRQSIQTQCCPHAVGHT
jgi:hypothetical protein